MCTTRIPSKQKPAPTYHFAKPHVADVLLCSKRTYRNMSQVRVLRSTPAQNAVPRPPILAALRKVAGDRPTLARGVRSAPNPVPSIVGPFTGSRVRHAFRQNRSLLPRTILPSPHVADVLDAGLVHAAATVNVTVNGNPPHSRVTTSCLTPQHKTALTLVSRAPHWELV